MTTSTQGTRPALDRAAVAAAARAKTAYRMQLTEAQVAAAMALSNWCTIEEMLEREFLGAYRGYYPKCSMTLRAEAVIAEIYDALAMEIGDPRRALRSGAWTPPARSTGGRCDG